MIVESKYQAISNMHIIETKSVGKDQKVLK